MKAVREQFEDVYERHLPEVMRLAMRYADNPDDAQDLAQEVFVRAYSAYDSFTPGTNTGAWLYRIAINVCTNAAKSRQRYHKYVIEEPQGWDVAGHLCDTVDELAQQQDHWNLKQAMRSLSSDQLLVLTLRFSDGLTLPEIAEVLDLPVDTVKSRLRTALGRLQSSYSYAGSDIAGLNQSPLIEVVQGQDLDHYLVDGERGAKIYHSLGSLYLRKGLIAAALGEWARAQQAAPDFLDAYLDSAQGYVALEQPTKAVNILENAVSRIQSADLHIRLADLYLYNLGDFDEGIKHSTRAVEMEPSNEMAHCTAGKVYCSQGIHQERLSWSLIDRTSIEKAIAESWSRSAHYLEEAIRIKKTFTEAISHLARVHAGQKLFDQAVRESDEAVINAEGDDAIMYRAGYVHELAGRLETSENYLRQAIAIKENALRVEILADVLRKMNRHQEKYDNLQHALTLTDNKQQKARIYVNMAVTAMHFDDLDLAVEHAETAILLDPRQVHARCNLAEAHLRKGDPPRIIINLCMEARKLDPRHHCLYRILAEAYYRSDKLDDALLEATTAVELEPQHAHLWLLRAKVLIKLGQFDEARKDILTALDLEPENEDAKTKLEEIEQATVDNLQDLQTI